MHKKESGPVVLMNCGGKGIKFQFLAPCSVDDTNQAMFMVHEFKGKSDQPNVHTVPLGKYVPNPDIARDPAIEKQLLANTIKAVDEDCRRVFGCGLASMDVRCFLTGPSRAFYENAQEGLEDMQRAVSSYFADFPFIQRVDGDSCV